MDSTSTLALLIGGIAGFILCPLTGVWAVGAAVVSGLAAGWGFSDDGGLYSQPVRKAPAPSGPKPA